MGYLRLHSQCQPPGTLLLDAMGHLSGKHSERPAYSFYPGQPAHHSKSTEGNSGSSRCPAQGVGCCRASWLNPMRDRQVSSRKASGRLCTESV